MKVQIDKEVERKFRELAMKKFGFRKGSLSKAAQEAFLMWISATEKEVIEFEEDPVEIIDGLMADVHIDSVRLQHEVKKIWTLKAIENVSR